MLLTRTSIRKPLMTIMVILAGYAQTIAPAIVDALKKHVARGGKVILLDHALGYDADVQKIADPAPAFGFHKIAGVTYRYERRPRRQIKLPTTIVGGEKFLKSVKVGDVIAANPNFPLHVKLIPQEDSTVVAKMDKHVVGVMNEAGNVFTLSLPHLRVNWRGVLPLDPTLAALIGDVLDYWDLERPITPKGGLPEKWELRAMEGEGYWLLAVMNRADEKRRLGFTVDFLPKGTYEVV